MFLDTFQNVDISDGWLIGPVSFSRLKIVVIQQCVFHKVILRSP